eukprot:418384-Prymnesium_polylepis.1
MSWHQYAGVEHGFRRFQVAHMPRPARIERWVDNEWKGGPRQSTPPGALAASFERQLVCIWRIVTASARAPKSALQLTRISCELKVVLRQQPVQLHVSQSRQH